MEKFLFEICQNIKMRNLFFYIFISAVYVVMLSACATQQTIEILHINDTHSHLAGMDENGKANYDNKSVKGSFARINKVIKKISKCYCY